MSSKVLITGAAGFIGSHTAEALANRGWEVVGIDNFNSYYNPALKRSNEKELNAKGIKIVNGDLRSDLYLLLDSDFEAIIHAAAQPGIASHVSSREYIENNIVATDNLINWAADKLDSLELFVNISTSSVYGKQATLSENSEPKPISYYGITKLAAEQRVLAAYRNAKVNACSLRLYSVYGPRERPEKLYSKLISSIYNQVYFPMHKGSEGHVRSFTYVEDIVQGIVSALENPDIMGGEIINLGSESEHTTAEGIALVEEIMRKKALIYEAPTRPGDQERTKAIITKAKDLLGYQPGTSLKKGLLSQVEWFKRYQR